MRLRRSLARSAVLAALAWLGYACTSSTEPAKVTAITLSASTVTLDAIGATQPIIAAVRDQKGKAMAGATVSWSSSAPSVATVAPSGLVTAVGNGTATLSATLSGITSTATVTVAQVPVTPVVVGGQAQTGPVNQALTSALQVRIEDRLGNAIPGRQVAFAVVSGGGSIATPTATSNASGLASTTWTLGSATALFHRVTATVEGNPTPAQFTATAVAGPATALRIAPENTANNQTVRIGTAVPILPAVQVVDVLGNGVAGATVTWSVTAGGGTITGGTSTTASTGIATVGSWTLGANVGVNTLQASATGFAPIVFTANGILDPCAPQGAAPITLGVPVNSSISSTDCIFNGNFNYEYYKLTLATSTPVIIEMSSTAVDSWLMLYDFNTLALIEENDDIVNGVIQNSRITRTLAAGTYLIRARTFDPGQFGTYTLLVRTAEVGVAKAVVLNAGNGQTTAPGNSLPVAPSVKVTDESGGGVAGVTVTFSTVPGFGAITGASAVTDANGVATVGSWVVEAGANVLAATVAGGTSIAGNPVVFTATGKASTAGFDINLRFVAMPTLSRLQTFNNAAARWEQVITGDIPSNPTGNLPAGSCSSPIAINETVDDVIIIVRLDSIDGPSNILGSAGPCFKRLGSSLPVLGSMRFDTADVAGLESGGRFGDVILHEMGHVIGIGTIWSDKGFLQNPSPTTGTGNDTHFNGPAAVTAFNTVGGSTYTGGAKVPVENNQGGAGTRNSHWRESTLQNELMTGFLNSNNTNPLSLLTVMSLQDLGYTVNVNAGDAFFVVTSFRAEESGGRPPIFLKDDVRQGPIYTVDRLGRSAASTGVRKNPKRPR